MGPRRDVDGSTRVYGTEKLFLRFVFRSSGSVNINNSNKNTNDNNDRSNDNNTNDSNSHNHQNHNNQNSVNNDCNKESPSSGAEASIA